MLVTLNIGMLVKGKPGNIGPRTVIADVVSTLRPLHIKSGLRHAASGEPTMVVSLSLEQSTIAEITPAIMFLCHLLSQDCIAGLTADGEGFLIGPVTTPYGGEFNPLYFINY